MHRLFGVAERIWSGQNKGENLTFRNGTPLPLPHDFKRSDSGNEGEPNPDGAMLAAYGFQQKNRVQHTLTKEELSRAEKVIAESHQNGTGDPHSDQTGGMSNGYFVSHHILSKEFPEAKAKQLFKTLASRARKAIKAMYSSGRKMLLPTAIPIQQEHGHSNTETTEAEEWRAWDSDTSASDDELDMYDAMQEDIADLDM